MSNIVINTDGIPTSVTVVDNCNKLIYVPINAYLNYGQELTDFTQPKLGGYYALTLSGDNTTPVLELYVYNGSNFVNFKGEKGDQGDQGDSGPKGDKGDSGDLSLINFHVDENMVLHMEIQPNTGLEFSVINGRLIVNQL